MSTPTPERVTDPDAAKKAKLENANLRVGILVAVVTLLIAVAGFLGIKLNNTSDEKQAAQGAVQTLQIVLSTQGSVLTQNASELEAAQRSLADLESQNSVLSSQLAATSAASAHTSAPGALSNSASTAGALRHQGAIKIAKGGETIDLDAQATDPKWGASLDGDGIASPLYVDSIGQIITNADFVLTAEGETADYETCDAKTGWAKRFYSDSSAITDQARYCLRTPSGRYATLRKLSEQDNAITLELTVWEAT